MRNLPFPRGDRLCSGEGSQSANPIMPVPTPMLHRSVLCSSHGLGRASLSAGKGISDTLMPVGSKNTYFLDNTVPKSQSYGIENWVWLAGREGKSAIRGLEGRRMKVRGYLSQASKYLANGYEFERKVNLRKAFAELSFRGEYFLWSFTIFLLTGLYLGIWSFAIPTVP